MTDETEQSRKPFVLFLAVMILVSPVVYLLSSAPVLAFVGDGSSLAPQWWNTAYAPVLWIEEKTDGIVLRTPIVKWFELWGVNDELLWRRLLRNSSTYTTIQTFTILEFNNTPIPTTSTVPAHAPGDPQPSQAKNIRQCRWSRQPNVF